MVNFLPLARYFKKFEMADAESMPLTGVENKGTSNVQTGVAHKNRNTQ